MRKLVATIGIITGIFLLFYCFLFAENDRALIFIGAVLIVIESTKLFKVIDDETIKDHLQAIRDLLAKKQNTTLYSSKKIIPATDFEGIPRNPGESDVAYWDRVDKTINKPS